MDIAKLRLAAQNISLNRFKTPEKLVRFMGAIQAQDYPMSKWGIGVRLKNSTEEIINEAIDKGEILRTHVLRPTWHFVSAENIGWMLELTASRIKSFMSSRNKQLELTGAVFKKSNKLFSDSLRGNNHLTREEIVAILNKSKVKTDNNRASHLLAEAELSGIICSGKTKGNKHTYALLGERVPTLKFFSREESLSKLAAIYFNSHGPATLKDFSWWSGLTLTDSKLALEAIKSGLTSIQNESQTYWFSKSLKIKNEQKDKVFLLPTFDEFIVSYTDRSAVLISEKHKTIVSNNGLFRAILVFNGKVIGTWKRTIKKDKAAIEFDFFEKPGKEVKELTIKEAEKFGKFIGKETELILK
jgi:DNA glycosylase AlkZ-like